MGDELTIMKTTIERVTIVYDVVPGNHEKAVEFLRKNQYKPVTWGPDRKYGLYDVGRQKVVGEKKVHFPKKKNGNNNNGRGRRDAKGAFL
jgi:hypothetical protein